MEETDGEIVDSEELEDSEVDEEVVKVPEEVDDCTAEDSETEEDE